MHGLGNDFIVIDGVNQKVEITPELARAWADRHFGVGCDQILLVERSEKADFKYRIWNQDGGEVEQCGNGARCFAKFVREKGLTSKEEITVETGKGIIILHIESDGEVRVNMGVPTWDAKEIPFITESAGIVQQLDVDGAPVEITALSMGNPHAVQIVPDVDTAPVTTQGPRIEHHDRFPERVNIAYMQIIDRRRIKLRIWERGTGETLSCGTVACAAVVAGVRRQLLDSFVVVETRGGSMIIQWDGDEDDLDYPVWMTGPAKTVFEGEIEI